MGRIEKTVFISYRRTNLPWALCIYQNLTANGYDVFFDYLSIDSGNFETAILDNIRARAHFVLILTPSALERCKNPNDWLRREIETAIDEKRNIVPLMLEGFDFGSPHIQEVLTGKLSAISSINALPVHSAYVFEALERLRTRFLNVALEDVNLPRLQAEVEEMTETQQTAANKAEPVTEEQLTAQAWFERGYVFQKIGNKEEALRCYFETIRLDPNLYFVYNNLGAVFTDLRNYKEAEAAYRKAINLNPSYPTAYYNLSTLLGRNLGRYKQAEEEIRKAINLDPLHSNAYTNLGTLLKKMRRFQEAEDAYKKAIEINQFLDKAYINLGRLYFEQGNWEGAFTVLTKAIELNPKSAECYKQRGLVNQTIGNLNLALEDYRKAINLQPDLGIVRMSLFGLLRKMKKDEEAKEHESLAREFALTDNEYNRACFEAICGNVNEAIKLLTIAFENGQFSKEWAKQDPDLENLRDDPRFQKLVG